MRQFLSIALLVAVATGSCKKGDEDPFISLRSRKARLTGEWQVQSFDLVKNFGEVRSHRFRHDSGMVYLYEDSATVEHDFNWTISFDADGQYISTETEAFDSNDVVLYTETRTVKGEWKFTGGNDVPKQSELLLMPTELTSQRSDQGSNIDIVTVTRPIEGQVFTIDRLSESELKFSYAVKETSPFEVKTSDMHMVLSRVN
jgi:hypothetical protein